MLVRSVTPVLHAHPPPPNHAQLASEPQVGGAPVVFPKFMQQQSPSVLEYAQRRHLLVV